MADCIRISSHKHWDTEVSVQLYLPIHKKLLTLEIAKGVLWDKSILCLIYVLSRYILNEGPVVDFSKSELHSFPIPFKKDQDPAQYSFVNVQKKNLLRREGQIHKIFDKEEYDIPLYLMSTIDGTENSKALQNFTSNHWQRTSVSSKYNMHS